MSLPDLVVRGRRVATGGALVPAAVHVRDGRIAAVAGYDDVPPGCPVDDVGTRVLFPGIVDTHVHVNEPGRTEWEGFETATRAAAAGGVTTIVDMPLNAVPPTTTLAGLDAKIAAAEGKCRVDLGFLGGAVPTNRAELARLRAAGVLGFKCFLSPSGVPEFDPLAAEDLAGALDAIADLAAPLFVHAELPDLLVAPTGDARRYDTWLRSRPAAAEDGAVDLLVRLARERSARAHVVHLSSAGALEAVRRAKDAGVAFSVETCPHYLALAAEDVPDGATAFKCAPPIRERENRDRLWSGLEAGLVDQIASDHSPSPASLKCAESGSFVDAWGGISSLELGLSIVWTEARARGIAIERLAEWMAAAPARLVGLGARKGRIAAGLDADLCVWDPDAERIVEPAALRQRHPSTPYAGRALFGVVEATYLRGVKVFDEGEVGPPRGRRIRTA